MEDLVEKTDREKKNILDDCEWEGEEKVTRYSTKRDGYVFGGATKGASYTTTDDWHDSIVRLGWRKEHGRDVGTEGDAASGVTAQCHASPGRTRHIEGRLDVHSPL